MLPAGHGPGTIDPHPNAAQRQANFGVRGAAPLWLGFVPTKAELRPALQRCHSEDSNVRNPIAELENRRSQMSGLLFHGGTIILEDSLVPDGCLEIDGDRITAVRRAPVPSSPDATVIDLADGYLAPGFIDLHVHCGAGAQLLYA